MHLDASCGLATNGVDARVGMVKSSFLRDRSTGGIPKGFGNGFEGLGKGLGAFAFGDIMPS